ncbi:hypothetical protein HYC85_016857 [Camellia sinensis]|uniref:Uncharacterized protein n=1 Tax=Camellia sinensis TaxID=4442 RepID=A0A7J7H0U5_CAMSI|nr:hypothetical protein HYC85_016857 [Camellia sinensis]
MEVVQGDGNSNYDDGNYNNNNDNKAKTFHGAPQQTGLSLVALSTLPSPSRLRTLQSTPKPFIPREDLLLF